MFSSCLYPPVDSTKVKVPHSNLVTQTFWCNDSTRQKAGGAPRNKIDPEKWDIRRKDDAVLVYISKCVVFSVVQMWVGVSMGGGVRPR